MNNTSNDIAKRAAAHATLREFLEIVGGDVFDGGDPKQVFKRVILSARIHRCPFIAEKSQREIAELLGVSEAAISSSLKLLRGKLQ